MKILNRIMCFVGYLVVGFVICFVLFQFIYIMFNQTEYLRVKDLRKKFSHGKLNYVEPGLSEAIISFCSALEVEEWSSVYNHMNKDFKRGMSRALLKFFCIASF